MKSWTVLASVVTLVALLAGGCSTLDEHQREWIFQPSDRSWGNTAEISQGMDDVWIDYQSSLTGEPVRLHGLWLGGPHDTAKTPVMLLLHGARFNVVGSAPRIRRMHDLGFSVLAIDYRGFGKSSKALPSEDSAREDAFAAWQWLAAHHPDQPRYIFGHSLGGAIGIDLASRVKDEQGVIVESTFTSIADVAASFKWGWLPFGPLITQRFDALSKVKNISAPLLVVHGTADSLINPTLGKKLYDAATVPKMFVLVEGGSHFDTNSVGQAQYRSALTQLFRMKEPPDPEEDLPDAAAAATPASAPAAPLHRVAHAAPRHPPARPGATAATAAPASPAI